MITANYLPNGVIESVYVDFWLLGPQEQEGLLAWLRAHDIDPGRVRTPATFHYSLDTDEWTFELFVKGLDGSGIRVDPATGDILIRRVRRRACRSIADWTVPARPGGAA